MGAPTLRFFHYSDIYIYTFEPFFSFSTVMLAAAVLNKIRRDRDERLEKKGNDRLFHDPYINVAGPRTTRPSAANPIARQRKKISIDCRCRGIQRSFFTVLIKLPSFFRFFAVSFFPFFVLLFFFFYQYTRIVRTLSYPTRNYNEYTSLCRRFARLLMQP